MIILSFVSQSLSDAAYLFLRLLGLGGELRGSKRIEDRVREAIKLGFTRIIIPAVTKRTKASDNDNEEDKLHHSNKEMLKTNASADYQRYTLQCSNILEVVALAFVNPDVVSSMKQKRRKKRSVLGESKQQQQQSPPSGWSGYVEYSSMDPSFDDEMGDESGDNE